MNVPPVSVERVQKCVVNFEIYRFLKKAANLPHPPLVPSRRQTNNTDQATTRNAIMKQHECFSEACSHPHQSR